MLREQVLTAGPLAARDVPIAFSAIPEFRNSSWFGCFSLRALISRLLALEPALKLEGDPNAAWTVVLRDDAEGTQLPTADLARRAVQEVKGFVARAAHPVPMATAAQQVAQLLGPGYSLRDSHWVGYGTFKALLGATHPQPNLLPVETRGGFLLDPARHDRGAADELPEGLSAFARRVSTITGTPPLSPAEYAGLFAALAALSTGEPTEGNQLSRAVRDRLHAEGLPVSRAQINFVLNGFRYTGFEIPGRSASDLAQAWRENILPALLDHAGVSPTLFGVSSSWTSGCSPPHGAATLGPGKRTGREQVQSANTLTSIDKKRSTCSTQGCANGTRATWRTPG